MADNKSIDTRIDEIGKQRKQLQIVSVVCFIFLVAVIILFMFRNRIIVIAALCVLILFYLFWYRRQKQKYSDRIAEAQILYGLCKADPSARYLGSSGLTLEEFEQFHLLPIRHDDHALMLRQGFSCEQSVGKASFHINGWETTFHYPANDGNKTSYQFLSGTLLQVQPSLLPQENILLLKEDVLSERNRIAFLQTERYSPISLPSDSSIKNVQVYSGTQTELTAERIASLTALFESISSLSALRIGSDSTVFFLKNRFYTANVKVRDLPTREQLAENPLPELVSILDFIQTLQNEIHAAPLESR